MQWCPVEKSHVELTHRACSPEQTLAAYAPLMPTLGITRLANITGLDCIGIPVVVAVRPASRGLATAQGKGAELVAAKVSALMESIETWHAERIEATTRVDTIDQMRRAGGAIDVTGLPRRAGRGLCPHRPIAWITAHELVSGETRWVPLDAVSCDFSATVVRHATFLQSTNGLASGNHVAEAILHGLCEVIERDAITLLTCGGPGARAERRLELSSVDDERCAELLARLARARVDVAVWDATSDLGLPVFSARIVDAPDAQRWQPRGVFRGYGCHPDRAVALARALTEAVQSRLTYVSGSRDDLFPERYRTVQRLEARGVGLPAAEPEGGRSFVAVPSLRHATFEEDIAEVLARLHAAGLAEVAVCDLTRADVGVPVVKVIVPGLENDVHRRAGCVPGPRAARVRERAW